MASVGFVSQRSSVAGVGFVSLSPVLGPKPSLLRRLWERHRDEVSVESRKVPASLESSGFC